MRRFFTLVILASVIYFLGGWIAVYLGTITKDEYFAYSGIVGSLLSVIGLIALTRPAISKSDVQAIELDALKSMAETAAELQTLEKARSKTKEEIDGLEIRRKEMELLVRKASLALFLKEQYAHHEQKVLEEVQRNELLGGHLMKAQETAQKLRALNEEIDVDPNVQQLRQIIDAAERRPMTTEELMRDLPFPFKSFSQFILLFSRSISNITKTLQ